MSKPGIDLNEFVNELVSLNWLLKILLTLWIFIAREVALREDQVQFSHFADVEVEAQRV